MGRESDKPLIEAAHSIAYYEGEPTRKGQPAGSSERGRLFEKIVSKGFSRAIKSIAQLNGFTATSGSVGSTQIAKMAHRDRVILFAFAGHEAEKSLVEDLRKEDPLLTGIDPEQLSEWIRMKYKVAMWVNHRLPRLGEMGWIPENSERVSYAGDQYRELYSGCTTGFDATVLYLVKEGEGYFLAKKCLLECKSAKSSKGEVIDGNAHERFSFQNLEYLEIATLYPRCELLLLTNDAYVRYRNKYHACFGVHALRLSNAFSWYSFKIITTAEQYLQLFRSWEEWLKND